MRYILVVFDNKRTLVKACDVDEGAVKRRTRAQQGHRLVTLITLPRYISKNCTPLMSRGHKHLNTRYK